MADLNVRDAKLVQYLNEAHAKEKELEAGLQVHIGMTTRAPYRKRLRKHLTETKGHARKLERRIKQLGGSNGTVQSAQKAATTAVGRAVATAKGPVDTLRGVGEQEQMLKNAKQEYGEEAKEIATYKSIIAFAEKVGDRETGKIARAILREEERMASFLERQIDTLTKAVVQAEVPASERSGGRRRSRSTSRKRTQSTSRKRTATSPKRSGTTARSRSRSTSRKSGSTSRGRRRSGSRS